jgi:hypothetical protein
MQNEVKKLFKTAMEYSLFTESAEKQILFSLKRHFDYIKDEDYVSDEYLLEMVLCSVFFDFLKKAISLNETKTMLQNILKTSGNGQLLAPLSDDSFFEDSNDGIQSAYITEIMKVLMQLIDDDEWIINFFTDYIQEIFPFSHLAKIDKSLKKTDWEKHLINYLMGEVTGEVRAL